MKRREMRKAAAGAAFNGIRIRVQVKLCRLAGCSSPLITISCGSLNCDTMPDDDFANETLCLSRAFCVYFASVGKSLIEI